MRRHRRDLSSSMEMDLDLTALTPQEREEVRAYWRYHARRCELLCETVGKLVPGPARILDVGPNLQTALLREALPRAHVDTMGFAHPLVPPREREVHRELDLNDAVLQVSETGDGRYEVVVLAEVIEHLLLPAELVFRYLAGWLRPDGVLVVQTPNAVALHKRLRMVVGISPYEPIRLSRDNPGHFHEFTLSELEDTARTAGFEPVGAITANYFGEPTVAGGGFPPPPKGPPPAPRAR